MINWELYQKRLNIDGTTQRERTINRAKHNLTKNVVNSPDYKSMTIDGIQQYVMVSSTEADNEKRIKTMPGETIKLGALITWNEMHWLVNSVDFDDEIYQRGTIVQCNRIIRWQNPITLEIIERWCLCTKPYTSNIEDGKVVSTSNREYKIQLPYDTETAKVDLDKRFMLEKIDERPRTYKVTSVDSLTNRYEDMETNSGFLVWNLTQDTSNHENDNEDLWICDYVAPEDAAPPPLLPGQLLCEIVGRKDIKIGGNAREFCAKFYCPDGVTVDDSIAAIWEFSCSPDDNESFKIETNGNLVSIRALDNDSLVGHIVNLKLKDITGRYEAKIDLKCVAI